MGHHRLDRRICGVDERRLCGNKARLGNAAGLNSEIENRVLVLQYTTPRLTNVWNAEKSTLKS